MAAQRKHGYAAAVDKVRKPPAGPLSVPAIRSAISLVEYTVHHEDVRRANGRGPRTDVDALQAAIWSKLGQLGGLMVRKAKIAPIALELHATGSTTATKTLGSGDRRVTITGEPIELLLFLYGRADQSEAELTGDPADVTKVRAASFGI